MKERGGTALPQCVMCTEVGSSEDAQGTPPEVLQLAACDPNYHFEADVEDDVQSGDHATDVHLDADVAQKGQSASEEFDRRILNAQLACRLAEEEY